MAEALLQYYAADTFQVESAGLEHGELNPLAVIAMQEMDIDISKKQTNNVFDFLKEGRTYDYVITVCDESRSEQCPIFPGNSKRLHWSFPDPSSLSESPEENLKMTIIIRNEIEEKIMIFVNTVQINSIN